MTEITIENYVGFALRTEPGDYVEPFERLCPHADVNQMRMLHGALGLASEVGELLEWRAKGHGHKNRELEEIGDMLWYASILMDVFGWEWNSEWFHNSAITAKFMGRGPEHFCKVVNVYELVDNLTFSISSICDVVKKSVFCGRDTVSDDVRTHLKVLCYCLGAYTRWHGTDIETVMATNIAKLKNRYPYKYSDELSRNRDLKAEERILEGNDG